MLSARQIAPGQTGEIAVTVNTVGLSGALSKAVAVYTNDPRQPQVVLTINAVVQPEFELKQRSLFFGSVPKGKGVSKDLLITIAPDKDVKLTGVESTDGDIAARLEPVPDSNGKKIKVIVTLKSDAKEGYHSGTIIIKTSSTRTPELRVMALGIVAPSQNH